MSIAVHERTLLLIASLVLINGVLAICVPMGALNSVILGETLILMMSWFAVHIIIRHYGHRGDPLFLPLAVFLSAIGLITVLRLVPHLFFLQILWNIVGLAAFILSAFLFRKIQIIAEYKYITGLLGIGLLLLSIVFGVDIGGHKSWLFIAGLSFQPSEFAKIFVVLFLAAYLTERCELLAFATQRYIWFELPHMRFIAPLIAVWGLTMVMFIVQRDLGSALLYFGVTITMAYMASGRFSYIVIGILLFLIGSVLCYKLYPHVQTRIDIWLNPWADPNGRAYQIIQSLFALGSGGLLGSGLTYGFPTMIPEVHTDFVFSAIGEELGFMGSAAILITYILLIYRAFRTALAAVESFSRLVAGGLAAVLALQVFLIIAGVTKFFPLTGITLPLVSYGGSSILSNYILLGMLFAISEARLTDEK